MRSVGFGEVIRSRRVSRGWSKAKLARLAGVHPSTVQRVEEGTIQPSTDRVRAFAQAFGISAGQLRSEAGIVDPLHEERLARRPTFEAYISEDDALTERQKRTLLEMYRDMVRVTVEQGRRAGGGQDV